MAEQKKSRKWDRNRKCGQNLRYKAENRHEKSHIRRIRKHVVRYGIDSMAISRLLKLAESLGINALNSAKEFIAEQRKQHGSSASLSGA